MDKNQFDFALPESDKRNKIAVYTKIIILPVLVYVAYLLSYFGFIELNIGINAIILSTFMLIIALLFTIHSAEYGCFVFECQKDDFKKELKSFILKSLLTIGKDTKSNANFDEFIKDYSKFIRNENIANVGAGVFSLLGVLGTFICIAISLAPLDASFDENVLALITSISSAFYVAIYGTILALWWIFFERFGITRFKKLVNRQKLVTKNFFWSKEELQERFMQEGISSFSKISTIFGYVSNKEFFSQLDKLIEQKFLNFTNLLENEENAITLSSEHIKQTLSSLSKSQKEQKDILHVYTDILNALNTFNKNFESMQIGFADNYAKLHTLSDEKLTRFERAVNTLVTSINNQAGLNNEQAK